MSILRHSAWAAAAAITLTAARFALAAIIARRLSQAGFGQYAYAQWLNDLAFLFCSLGATGVAARYVAEFRSQPGWLSAFIRRWRQFALGLPFLAMPFLSSYCASSILLFPRNCHRRQKLMAPANLPSIVGSSCRWRARPWRPWRFLPFWQTGMTSLAR